MLKAQLGEQIYSSWFKTMEFEGIENRTLKVSVPVKFVRNWIHEHYSNHILHCARTEFADVERIEVIWREPGAAQQRAAEAARSGEAAAQVAMPPQGASSPATERPHAMRPSTQAPTRGGGLEGSPLDPRYTFDSFVIGASNRMAHAGATQVAETVMSDNPGFNPLYIHSQVGLGKSHLLQAIAWDVKRRSPHAQVLYLTAERFRYQFVEALRSSDPLAFKERFRNIHLLLIDDLEFLQGERTEQEFEHIINALLDGGRQVVVASARAPNHIDRLNERMRSRLQRGLVTELLPLDYELRQKVLDKRLAEKRAIDPSFSLSRDLLDLLASRLTENGRELEGAVTRLYATWQYMRTPITLDIAEFNYSRSRAESRTAAHQDRRHPADHFSSLRGFEGRSALAAASSFRRLAAADRHVPRKATDRAVATGDRSTLRRPRSYDGAARHSQDRGRNHEESAARGRA